MPLLSVIIPVYNPGPFLKECLSSLLLSFPENLSVEIILVDDGSTDGSGAVCMQYAADYPYIVRTFRQENRGVAAARNTGLSLARGAYIAWVDPDDSVAHSWFTSICEVLTHEAPDLLVMDSVRFQEDSRIPEIYGRPEGFLCPDLFAADLYRDIRMLSGLPNKVIRASVFAALRFDESLPILEDYAAMPRILRQVNSVYYLPKCLYHYRQHSGSLLHQVTAERAFLSFRIARQRATEAEPEFRRAARTAASIQALNFCRGCHIHSGFCPSRQQIRDCVHYVRKSMLSILFDPEVPLRWKMKFLLLSLGFSHPLRNTHST